MGILYRKLKKVFQEGGIMLSSVPTLYDPGKDSFLAMRMKEKALDVEKYKNAYSNLLKQRKAQYNASKNTEKPEEPKYVQGKYFSSGPAGMRNLYQTSMDKALAELNSKISADPNYIHKPEYINNLNFIGKLHAEGEAALKEFDKYSKVIDDNMATNGDKMVFMDNSIIAIDNKTGKHEVIPALDYVDKINEVYKDEDGKEVPKYTPLTVSMYKELLDNGVHKNTHDYKKLSEMSVWNDVVDSYINPIVKKIKDIKISLKSGDSKQGINIDGMEISNEDVFKMAKQLGNLQKVETTSNSKKLGEVTQTIVSDILQDSRARDAVYNKVLSNPINKKLLRDEKDKKKREELFGHLVYNTIFNEVFLSEAVKYAGTSMESGENGEGGISGYLSKLDDEVKLKFNFAFDTYDILGKHTLEDYVITIGNPTDKKKALKVTYKAHTPYSVVTYVKEAGNAAANDETSLYGNSLSSLPELEKIIDFKNAKVLGQYDPVEVFESGNLTTFLNSSQIVDPNEIKSTTMKVGDNGVLDKGHYEFVMELQKAVNDLVKNGAKYIPSNEESMMNLREEALNMVLNSSTNKDAVTYLKNIVGDVDDIKSSKSLDNLYKTFNGRRVYIFDVIGHKSNEDEVTATNLMTGEKENLVDNNVVIIDQEASNLNKESYYDAAYTNFHKTNKIMKNTTDFYEGQVLDRDAVIATLVVPVHEAQLAMQYSGDSFYGSTLEKLARAVAKKEEVSMDSIITQTIADAYRKLKKDKK